jgi:hypothetical protein
MFSGPVPPAMVVLVGHGSTRGTPTGMRTTAELSGVSGASGAMVQLGVAGCAPLNYSFLFRLHKTVLSYLLMRISSRKTRKEASAAPRDPGSTRSARSTFKLSWSTL